MNKAHADALTSKHAALQSIISEEEHRPQPDTSLLHRLKKEKLRLKDELVGH
ncbi:YdcH family protein [Sphingomonas piscis]|uniref:YdcH family protein n=1 Tax=Sphingomonas piscis TaxID=2714943 RepID=A0A6G7YSD3_9SPHN|nr:YdcH family protein [Sphingomonas piscis]QIK79644.1 YdcH family protein [Sphingomonas piscis]